jgi:SOS-response transcriptional repressor LexA
MEIAAAMRVRSVNSVLKILGRLEKKGYISRESGKARSLRLLVNGRTRHSGSQQAVALPIRTADTRSRFDNAPVDDLYVDRIFLRGLSQPGKCFVARVADHGADPDGIRSGDFVVVEPVQRQRLVSGDLVLCRNRGFFLARRFVDAGEHGLLLAADTTFPSIPIQADTAETIIEGRVAGVLRRL